jgi:hypothetical protein
MDGIRSLAGEDVTGVGWLICRYVDEATELYVDSGEVLVADFLLSCFGLAGLAAQLPEARNPNFTSSCYVFSSSTPLHHLHDRVQLPADSQKDAFDGISLTALLYFQWGPLRVRVLQSERGSHTRSASSHY